MVLIKIWEYWGSRIGIKSPSTETNEHSFLRMPGPTRGCRGNDDDDCERWKNMTRKHRCNDALQSEIEELGVNSVSMSLSPK
jgi:hypothetical protein